MNFYQFYTKIHNPPMLHLSWNYDNSTFKSWLMSEIAQNLVQDLDQWQTNNADELPFHSLFKDKTRTTIPFTIDPTALNILKKIKKAGLLIDFKTGIVSNGKRQIRLGKYVLNKISLFSEKEKEWWTHSGTPIEELEVAESANDHAIVVSRNPIDIVRMSDHDGWTSCHAPSREYFQCAISDAKGAGAIAYVVKKNDLDKIELEAPEIFKDKKRDKEGVTPVARVRLRKFVHKTDEYDLAVPENRTYGKKFPGLENSVREWALQAQQDKLQGKRPRMSEFQLMGGSYQDTQGGELFNYLFGDDLDHGDAEYGGEDEHQNMIDQMETEVDQIEREYQNKFTICSFYASVENEGHPSVSFRGDIELKVPEELMTYAHTEVDTNLKWNETPDHKIREAIRTKWAKANNIYGINNIEVEYNRVRINIYTDGSTTDDFREFLEDTLTDIDDRADQLKHSLYQLFMQFGYAEENKVSFINRNWDTHPHQFQNFIWEGEEPNAMISLKQPIILHMPAKTSAGYQHEYGHWQDQFKQAVMKELHAWADKIHHTEKQQPYLFPIPIERPFSQEFKIIPEIELKPANKPIGQYGNLGEPEDMTMEMTINFEPFSKDKDVEDVLKFVEFLDKNYARFVKIVEQIYTSWSANWT